MSATNVQTAVITGASSGIGLGVAQAYLRRGANVVLNGRNEAKLRDTAAALGHPERIALVPGDVGQSGIGRLIVDEAIERFGRIDVLVNNAGRSIRRSIALSYDRFHDFERTMQLNYFGSLRMILRSLPVMSRNRSRHVINISSIGVLTNAPRFSAYVASKAALDAFSRCAASEYSDTGISFTTINMPLVRTPMIAPTRIYDNVPTITPDEAADLVKKAVIYKPQRVATRLGIFAQTLHAVAPKVAEIVMNSAFRIFPDSTAAKGISSEQESASQEQIAFASLMRGIHW